MSEPMPPYRCESCWALYGVGIAEHVHVPERWPCRCGGLIARFYDHASYPKRDFPVERILDAARAVQKLRSDPGHSDGSWDGFVGALNVLKEALADYDSAGRES